MDHRAVRLALGLTIAGASMLTTGVATWLITAVGGAASGLAATDLRLAALALLAGGAACGVAMAFALAAAGRAQPDGPPLPDGAPGLAREVPRPPGPAPSLAGPRSLMNPPPPSPPPLAPSRLAPPQPFGEMTSEDLPSADPPVDPRPAPRVWWRAARSPASSWDDNSEEWLRSLRGPAFQQPPPHSAE
jgi:hypothetical protein